MHHYFYNYPWLTMCPFNKVQEINVFLKKNQNQKIKN